MFLKIGDSSRGCSPSPFPFTEFGLEKHRKATFVPSAARLQPGGGIAEGLEPVADLRRAAHLPLLRLWAARQVAQQQSPAGERPGVGTKEGRWGEVGEVGGVGGEVGASKPRSLHPLASSKGLLLLSAAKRMKRSPRILVSQPVFISVGYVCFCW